MSEEYGSLRGVYTFSSIEKVRFGVDAVAQLGAEAKQLDVDKHCLIITDKGVEKAGLVDKASKPLRKEGFDVEVYSKALPEPTIESVQEAVDSARKTRVDFVVGLGGGSSMDTAKVVGRALTNPGDIRQYLDEGWKEAGIPVIAIPTTAGTGAEFTSESVISLTEEKVKYWFDDVRAKVAIVDPLMTLTLPPKLTAATGMDALSHAIESALTVYAFPLTQVLAFESIRLISKNLRRATSHGDDVKARYNMSLATLMEAFSEGNAGDVEAHAVAHTVGAFYHIHHGMACGIALPYAMEWNIPVNLDVLVRIADAMGEDSEGLSRREAAYKGIYAVKKLLEDLNLPTSLSMVEGAGKKDLGEIVKILAENPRAYPAFAGYCKRKMTKEDVKKFLERMWQGKLGKP
ncbi:MAG: iron-containing alcohol dehydrogenase [Candidatus Bathyarchaeia archaeon]